MTDFNRDKINEMIDAINRGTPYQVSIEPRHTNCDSVRLELAAKSFSIGLNSEFNFNFAEIDDPGTARFIAGALIAWANRVEDVQMNSEMTVGFLRLLGETGHHQKHTRDDCWRYDWYRRSVGGKYPMTRETMEVNKRDLTHLKDDLSRRYGSSHPAVQDIGLAIKVLDYCLDGGDPNDVPRF